MNVMEDLKAYVDGELSPERRSEIETAMEQDEAIRQELEEIRVLSRLIGDCVLQPEPVGLEQTLLRLESRKGKPLFVRMIKEPVQYGWIWAMAAFLFIAIVLPVFFPVFAQSKESAMATYARRPELMKSAQDDYAKSAAEAPATEARQFDPATSAPVHKGAVRSGEEGAVFGDVSQAPAGAGGGFNGLGGAGKSKSGIISKAEIEGHVNGSVGGTTKVDAPHIVASPKPSAGEHQVGGGLPQASFQKPLLIRTGNLAIEVASAKRAQADATNMAKQFGGYVEQSNLAADETNEPTASLTLRVPEERFEDAMNRFRGLGKVTSESATGQDVTVQIADTEARLKVMRAEEESDIVMLRGARKISEMLEIKDRLSQVREQIESLDAQRKALRSQATYSTITLSLNEPTRMPVVKPHHEPGWFDQAWDGAKDRASGLGRWFAEVGMNLLFLSPVWVPVVFGLWWLGRRKRMLR
jgi:hypothetical protein